MLPNRSEPKSDVNMLGKPPFPEFTHHINGVTLLQTQLPVPGVLSDFMISKVTTVGVGVVNHEEKRPEFTILVGGNPVKRLEEGCINFYNSYYCGDLAGI